MLSNKLRWNLNRNSSTSIQENTLENICEMAYFLSRTQSFRLTCGLHLRTCLCCLTATNIIHPVTCMGNRFHGSCHVIIAFLDQMTIGAVSYHINHPTLSCGVRSSLVIVTEHWQIVPGRRGSESFVDTLRFLFIWFDSLNCVGF